MKETIGWGILGAGIIAKEFARCLRELPDARVAAVAARDIERSRSFAETYGGKAYDDYGEMANDPNVDVVYVATTHNLHEKHVLLCLEAGKAVLCEKPLSVNAAEAERMYAAAEEKGLLLVDGLWSRYFPAWEFVVDYIKGGEMGKILAINSTTSWGANPINPLPDFNNRIQNPDLAGGALLDAGVYSLAATTLSLGEFSFPKTVKSLTHINKHGVDERDSITLQYDSGVICNLMCGISGLLQETHIMLEEGTIYIPRHRNPDTIILNKRTYNKNKMAGTRTVEHYMPFASSGFQFEAAHVQDCLRQGLKVSPRVSKEESLVIMRICDEVRRQANFKYPFE